MLPKSKKLTNFPGCIMDIEYSLPDTIITNEHLSAIHPEWNVMQAAKRTGVYKRHIANRDETAYDLALLASSKLLDNNPGLAEKIDGVIFCTQTPDFIMPSNAFLLQRDLKLNTNILAFDYNLACSGFVYGILMASSFISTGIAKNILLVNSDTYSKHIDSDDRSTQMLFGDGAAVTWVSTNNQSVKSPLISNFDDISCSSDGLGWNSFYINSGGCRNPNNELYSNEYNDKIQMNGLQVLNFVGDRVVKQIKELLFRNQLQAHQINRFFFHQASALALDLIHRKLNINSSLSFSNLALIGNTVSASLPILIKENSLTENLTSESPILICGYGVGYSWGSILARK